MTKIRITARMTPAQIEAIQPRSTPYLVSDEVTANLFLKVNPRGGKVWTYDAAPLPGGDGGRIKDNLGRWPVVSLKTAREAASAYNDERLRGVDPRAAKRAAAEEEKRAKEQTVGRVFDDWIEHKRRVKEAVSSLDGYLYLFDKDVRPAWGDRPIREFDKAAVRSVIKEVQKRGSLGTANNLLTMLCTFLRWCIVEDYFEAHGALYLPKTKADPDAGSRELSVRELALCWIACERIDTNERDAVRLLILTGLRKMEVLAANGREFTDGTWTIPASRMRKGKREHHMALGAKGREIFERRSAGQPGALFGTKLYPSMYKFLAENALAAMVEVGGEPVEHWTLHSIRKGVRTALGSDEMDEMGETFSENISEIVVAHSLGSLNRRYNKSKYARQVGRALDAWERLLQREIDKLTGDNVVSLRASAV